MPSWSPGYEQVIIHEVARPGGKRDRQISGAGRVCRRDRLSYEIAVAIFDETA